MPSVYALSVPFSGIGEISPPFTVIFVCLPASVFASFTALSNLPTAVVKSSLFLTILVSSLSPSALLYCKLPILVVSIVFNVSALATSLSATSFPSVSNTL